MSELVNKSKSNKQAADLLIRKHKYAPSIHCSYYGFLQIATEMIQGKLGKSIESVIRSRTIQYPDGRKEKPNTHAAIRAEISDHISEGKDKAEFNQIFNDLKSLRVHSDYKETIIEINGAVNARKLSDQLIEVIKSIEK